jgi:hypothetical protein
MAPSRFTAFVLLTPARSIAAFSTERESVSESDTAER